eukprot:EG_transcript_26225
MKTKRSSSESEQAEERTSKKTRRPALPDNCMELKGSLHRVLQCLLFHKVKGLRKVGFEQDTTWATVVPAKLDEAVGRYVILERELVVAKAPEGSPGNATLSGGLTVLFQYLQQELSIYGVVDVVRRDGRFFAKAASEEFVERMQQRGVTTLKGVKVEFAKPS